MAGETLLRCIPDPQGGAGVDPCPPGYIVSTVEVNLPQLLGSEWGTVAAASTAMVVLLFATGLGVGWVMRMMEGR